MSSDSASENPAIGSPAADCNSTLIVPAAEVAKLTARRRPWNVIGRVTSSPPRDGERIDTNPSCRSVWRVIGHDSVLKTEDYMARLRRRPSQEPNWEVRRPVIAVVPKKSPPLVDAPGGYLFPDQPRVERPQPAPVAPPHAGRELPVLKSPARRQLEMLTGSFQNTVRSEITVELKEGELLVRIHGGAAIHPLLLSGELCEWGDNRMEFSIKNGSAVSVRWTRGLDKRDYMRKQESEPAETAASDRENPALDLDVAARESWPGGLPG